MSEIKTRALAAWSRLVASAEVREQQAAFTCATGIALVLLPRSEAAGNGAGSVFCVQGCLGEPSGSVCRRRLLQTEQRAVTHRTPVRYRCPSGLVKILVPVFLGGQHVGSLLAGPFMLEALDGARLRQLLGRLEPHGLGDREEQLRTTWRFSPQLSAEKCAAAETLLRMFARQLEESGKRELEAQPPAKPALLGKIEAFLAESPPDRVSLKEVAARVNLSPCHFCAVFKKQTGVTFSQYRLRLRLDKARELLRNPERRVSDVAFEAGFESIPYFNRAFRRRFGCAPSEFRTRLDGRNPGQENRNPSVAVNGHNGLNH
jgi:AraC-like DNA-binding protein